MYSAPADESNFAAAAGALKRATSTTADDQRQQQQQRHTRNGLTPALDRWSATIEPREGLAGRRGEGNQAQRLAGGERQAGIEAPGREEEAAQRDRRRLIGGDPQRAGRRKDRCRRGTRGPAESRDTPEKSPSPHRSTGKATRSSRATVRPAGTVNETSRNGSEGASGKPVSSCQAGKKKRRSTTLVGAALSTVIRIAPKRSLSALHVAAAGVQEITGVSLSCSSPRSA